jgi:hypothetical protein
MTLIDASEVRNAATDQVQVVIGAFETMRPGSGGHS